MNATFLKKAMPHVIAVVIFLIIAVIYCQPALQGKVVNQHDIQGWRGMAQQSYAFKEKYGHVPYWTNSNFSGMPAYQIAMETPNRVSINYIHQLLTLYLPKPINFFFLACITMYFLLMVMRLNPWVGVMGGIAYAYSTFDPIIVAVGHDTQMVCIAYAPAIIGSLLLILQKRYFTGTVLLALFAALMLSYNHIQIIYYTLITALAIAIGFAIQELRRGEWKHVVTSGLLALLAGGIALGVNTVSIWPTNEFAKETMRGGRSELTSTSAPENKTKGGLDKDYAFQYSYGIGETFTLLVPGMFGGGSSGSELQPGSSKFAEKLSEAGMPEDNAVQYANAYAYWGDQPGTSGPVYLGAITCFLFIAGMVFIKSWLKWPIAAACLFGIMLAWGTNLQGINYFLYDHLPLYNKFRALTMALVIPQLGFVIIAGMAANEMLFGSNNAAELWKKFRLTCIITLAVFALLAVMYISAGYTSKNDAAIRQNFASGMLQQQAHGQQPTPQMQQQADEFARSIMKGLESDRQHLFGKDLLRSFFFILLAAGAIYLFIKQRIKPVVALAALVLFSSIDLLAVGKRYLNNDSFVEPTDFESSFVPTAADNQIMADHDKNFRVFDQSAGDPFSDARASYHHNSVGGYNPAKLALYQDIIERQLSKGNINVFNMLNTKYFITANPSTRQPEARINTGANGNAWFIKGLQFAKNADEEMNVLNTLNTRDSAVVDARYRNTAGTQISFDSTAAIRMIENLNDKITYKSSARMPQFAVFSEIYYPHGWDAYIDGKKTDYCRVNYVLRGMPVPAGSHTIEFRFEPRSVILGDRITMWFSILLYVLLVAMLILEFRKNQQAAKPPQNIRSNN